MRSRITAPGSGTWIMLPMLVAGLLTGLSAQAQTPVAGLTGTDGGVRRAAIDGQRLVLAGDFERVGRPCGSWVSFDLASGDPDETGPVVSGQILEAIPDGEGGFFLAGGIRAVNGVERWGLAHLRDDGSLAPWAPTVTGLASALALSHDTLFVGGSFTQVNGVARSNLVALDVHTGTVLSWNVPVDGFVRALDLVDDTLYVGGDFRSIAGLPRPGIGAIAVRTSAATPWTLALVGSPFASGTPLVTRIVHDGDRLYVGGDFNAVGATETGGFAVVHRTSGELQPSAHPSLGTWVERILIHGGRVYVSGNTSISTPAGSAFGLFAISRSTLQAIPWVPAVPRSRRIAAAIAASGDRLFVSEGWWDPWYPPQPLSVVDTVSGSAVAFPAPLRATGGAQVFLTEGVRLFAGGPFQLQSSTPRRAMAEIDLSTGQPTDREFELLAGEWPLRVAADAGRVFAGTVRGELVGFEGGSAPVWRRPFFDVKCMSAAPGHLVVAGRESSNGPESVFDLDPATGATRPWAPAFANPAGTMYIHALASDDERLYVGGFFQSVNTQPTGGVAAFRWSDLGLEPVSFGILGVRALAAAPGRVIAVGDVAGRPSPTLAALDRSSGALLPWAPLGGAWLDPYKVNGVAVLDDDVFVGYPGPFTPYGQALFHRTSLSTPNWASGPLAAGRANDVVSGAGRLVAVGEYVGFGTAAASSVVALASPTVGVPWSSLTHARELAVWPQPARDRIAIRWLQAATPTRLEILDVTGRRVHTLALTPGRAGSLEWDLRRSDGSRVPAGVHFAVVTAADGTRSMARFVVLR